MALIMIIYYSWLRRGVIAQNTRADCIGILQCFLWSTCRKHHWRQAFSPRALSTFSRMCKTSLFCEASHVFPAKSSLSRCFAGVGGHKPCNSPCEWPEHPCPNEFVVARNNPLTKPAVGRGESEPTAVGTCRVEAQGQPHGDPKP